MGRFIQADTIVPEPGNPQSLNRYSYANNNSLKYTDPSGHRACAECVGGGGGGGAILVAGAAGGASLFSQAVQALNVAMADAQVFLQSLAQPFGNQLPALVDQVSQAGQPASSNAGNTAGPGGLDPNDPWDRFSRLVEQGKTEIDAAVEASAQGSGDRFVIGPYKTGLGVANYIQEANGPIPGKYFDAGVKLWDQLARQGMAEQVNRQVIYEQMKAGISRIDISSGLTIRQILDATGRYESLRMEVRYIMQLANEFGYIVNADATGWIKQ